MNVAAITPEAAAAELDRRRALSPRKYLEESAFVKARGNFEAFFQMYPPARPYIYGRHTLAIIRRLDRAVKDFERGKSTCLIINVPYRHGKSDIASRRLGPWFLGRNPDKEVLLVAYNYDLAVRLSRKARACFSKSGWPLWKMRMSEDHASLNDWAVAFHEGTFLAAGIDGTITGTGAHLLVIDDYIKNRREAESAHQRDGHWDAFRHDIFTRLAPVYIIVFVVTRWNADDLCGRVIDASTPGTQWYSPDFPVFEVMKYPMRDKEGKWLFPERFSDEYYEEQWGMLGEYGRNSVAQQDPRPRHGNMLRADLVEWMDPEEFDRAAAKAGVKWRRGWDLASTAKQRMKDDPDYTVGTRAAFKDGAIWIEDRVKGQWTATKRDEIMKQTAIRDGRGTRLVIETVAGYKDTYDRIATALRGYASVEQFTPRDEKVARASPLEAPFETGRVRAKRGPWNDDWMASMLAFPGGSHDDDTDSLVTAVYKPMHNKSFVKVL